jgi:hypothetical protein
MKCHVSALALLLLLTGPTALLSQERPRPTPPPAVAATPPTDDNPTLKQISFHGTRLSEAISYLRDSCPRFKVVVVPDPQCADPDPALPDIELKNVDLNQFLDVLKQSLPQLSIDGVEGQKGPVCLLKIGAQAGTSPPELQVFRLSPLIPAGADRKAYLNDILSLVQAALEAQGSASNVLMKVHEGTGTLIFRGNAVQTEVLIRALKALEPTWGESERAKLQEHAQANLDRMQARVAQLEERLKEAEMEAAVARKQVREQMNDLEMLKARLAAQGDKKP